ncbi:MAG: cell division protein FtsA, partial [Caldilineaceae bacterium]|nr:cell division protein FtsA [Caldilineaceae bacterium]
PQNQDVIHTIARSWTVDGQAHIFQPLGMTALRLEVDAHIVTGSRTAMSNLVQCVATNGIDVDELVLEPLASNKAVLTPDERKMGVAVVDIGGGTTDIAVFIDDALCYTAILDVGGHHLTNDVAIGLHAPFETAEDLKRRFGHAVPERVAEDETVWVTVFGEKSERSFSRQFICQILAARLEEICELVHENLKKSGYRNKLPAGIVLTGGSSLLPGISELGRDMFTLPVRVGSPSSRLPITGLSRALQSPTYATSVGLLLWGLHDDGFSIHRRFEVEPAMVHSGEWVGQATRWFKNLLPG